MRKLFSLLVLAALVLGVAGTALAENGTINPFGQTRTMEHGPIRPW